MEDWQRVIYRSPPSSQVVAAQQSHVTKNCVPQQRSRSRTSRTGTCVSPCADSIGPRFVPPPQFNVSCRDPQRMVQRQSMLHECLHSATPVLLAQQGTQKIKIVVPNVVPGMPLVYQVGFNPIRVCNRPIHLYGAHIYIYTKMTGFILGVHKLWRLRQWKPNYNMQDFPTFTGASPFRHSTVKIGTSKV